MVNQVAIIVTIAAIMISLFGLIFQAQEVSAAKCINLTTGLPCHPRLPTTNPAAANTTAGSNMTGAAGNTTASNTTAHGSSIHTTNPAAFSTHDSGRSIRNVK